MVNRQRQQPCILVLFYEKVRALAYCLHYATITKHFNLNLIDRLQFPWLTVSRPYSQSGIEQNPTDSACYLLSTEFFHTKKSFRGSSGTLGGLSIPIAIFHTQARLIEGLPRLVTKFSGAYY